MGTQKENFDSHFQIKLQHFEVIPYVCWVRGTLTILPNIALWMPAHIVGRATMALQCTSILRWFLGNSFFCLVYMCRLEKQQKLIMIMFEGHI